MLPLPDAMLLEKAAWGELVTKYVFWARYIYENEPRLLQTPREMQFAMRAILVSLNMKHQTEMAWRAIFDQIADGQLEDLKCQTSRYLNELCQVMKNPIQLPL